MATIVNDRDTLMQATVPRVIAGGASQNSAVVYIYQRSASATAPELPSSACTYTFATGGLTGLNNGWSSTFPGGAQKYLYVAMVTVSGSGATVVIPAPPAAGSWNAASLLSANGSDGVNGANGANGANGYNGSNGARGSITAIYTGYPYSYWDNSYANQAFYNLGYYDRIVGDIATLAATSGYSETRFWSGSSWVTLSAYISGNMLVSGTFAADKIAAGSTLSGVSISGGSINISSGNFRVYTNGDTSISRLGVQTISSDNTGNPASPAVTVTAPIGYSSANAMTVSTAGSGYAVYATGGSKEAIFGYNGTASVNAHGVRGQSLTAYGISGVRTTGVSGGVPTTVSGGVSLTSGLVGCASGYDFYADGQGTNYGPFTGAHDALIALAGDLQVGDIVIDAECISRSGLSNTIFRVERSSTPYQNGALGVLALVSGMLSEHVPTAFLLPYAISTHDDGPSPSADATAVVSPEYEALKSLYLRGAVNALGEGQINIVAEGGDIQVGDFIVTSSTPGKGMRMDMSMPVTFDLMSCIVARAREAATFTTTGEVKTIACIYVCG